MNNDFINEIECLRGHFNQALDNLLLKYGATGVKAPGKAPTKKQRQAYYDKLITTGQRAKKPEWLKNKKPGRSQK